MQADLPWSLFFNVETLGPLFHHWFIVVVILGVQFYLFISFDSQDFIAPSQGATLSRSNKNFSTPSFGCPRWLVQLRERLVFVSINANGGSTSKRSQSWASLWQGLRFPPIFQLAKYVISWPECCTTSSNKTLRPCFSGNGTVNGLL